MNLRLLPVAIMVSGLAAGCGWSDPWPPIGLDEADRAAAEERLYPRFAIMQEGARDIDAELAAEIRRPLERLAGQIEAQPDVDFMITREPEPDAGCLAGGRIFISQGMLAWIEHADELGAAVALALTACGQASQTWRNRARTGLVGLDEGNWLMHRYRDFRLESIAPEYNLAVAVGCGAGNDCSRQAAAWLEQAELPDGGLARLAARIRGARADAAWLKRFPDLAGLDGGQAQPDPGIGELPGELLGEFHGRREGFMELAEVWRQLHGGELREAYRAQIRARQAIGATPEVLLVQARISLANMHPDRARQVFQVLQRGQAQPDEEYWQGLINVHLRNTATGAQQLQRSLEVLPRVSTHFYLGRVLERQRRGEQAVEHYRAVLAAGPVHPQTGQASVRLAAMDGG